MPTTSRGRKFTHNIINMWQRELVRALQMICTLGFLQKLSTIDDIMKYCGKPVSRYIIVVQFLIAHIPRMWADDQCDGCHAEYRWRPCESSVIPFPVPCRKLWLMPTARVTCSNADNIGKRKT